MALKLDSQSSDNELIMAFAQEKTRNKAFECIIDKFQKRVYWHVRRMVIDHDDADDVTQNTFIKVWKQLDHYRGEAKLYTWIYRIATNESLQFIQKRRSDRHISIDDDNSPLIDQLTTDAYFDGNGLELKLQSAILTLPDKQRQVFLLKYYDNMKYEEMSEILETSVGALKASYFHAVKKLEAYFGNIKPL